MAIGSSLQDVRDLDRCKSRFTMSLGTAMGLRLVLCTITQRDCPALYRAVAAPIVASVVVAVMLHQDGIETGGAALAAHCLGASKPENRASQLFVSRRSQPIDNTRRSCTKDILAPNFFTSAFRSIDACLLHRRQEISTVSPR
jgi:hypothetical protein